MRRIYFLVPDTTTAKAIVDELLLARFKEKQIHVVARKDTPLDNLPEAHLAQRSDLIPALERGVAAGGLSGLLAGTVAVTFPPAGLVVAAHASCSSARRSAASISVASALRRNLTWPSTARIFSIKWCSCIQFKAADKSVTWVEKALFEQRSRRSQRSASHHVAMPSAVSAAFGWSRK